MTKPTMIPVESSNVKAIGHDAGANALHVSFGSGHYVHEGVPADLHEKFMQAESKGRFYNEHIKGKFPAKKAE